MRKALFVLAIAIAANAAQAHGGSLYFGAGITDNNLSPTAVQNFGDLSPKISSTSWQVFAGFRPITPFAVEAAYLDLGSTSASYATPQACVSGSVCTTTLHSDAKALAAYAVGFLPFRDPSWDVYGKLGLARFEENSSSTTTYASYAPYRLAISETSTALSWGVGVQAHIGIFGGRLEYAGFDKASTSVFSLSVFLNLN
jgi:hypothetical protein